MMKPVSSPSFLIYKYIVEIQTDLAQNIDYMTIDGAYDGEVFEMKNAMDPTGQSVEKYTPKEWGYI